MKSALFGTATFAALCLATPVIAADMPARYAKAPPAMVSPAYNWSGFYVGVHAGYGFSEDDTVVTTGQLTGNVANVAGGARPAQVRLDRDGFVGGGQIGYNWQLDPKWVIGVEADIQGTGERGTSVNPLGILSVRVGDNTLSAAFSTTNETSFPWFATFRGRAGFLADPSLLLYATGGLAVGEVKF